MSPSALVVTTSHCRVSPSGAPATRVVVDPGDPQAVGTTLTGYTGYGPLTLVDRMSITELRWDDDAAKGYCEVEKLGPVLRGRAGFTVVPDSNGSTLEWFEDVSVKYVPQFLAPVLAKAGALGFAQGMKGLAKNLSSRSTP